MFKPNDIVKVLIPNVASSGYDYRLNESAEIGAFVRVSVMNRPYVGVIIGAGDSGLGPEKIKNVQEVIKWAPGLSAADMLWISKMSEWTMMPMGAVLRLIVNVPDAFLQPKQEQLYSVALGEDIRMTNGRQLVLDAFASNDNEPMSVSDIQNIAHVSAAVVNTMIRAGALAAVATRNQESVIRDQYNYFDTGSVKLNDEQQRAADEISAGFGSPLEEGCPQGGVSIKKLPENPDLKERAKELRKAGSLPEALLWPEISGKKINGLNFDRQKVIGNYIVDFFCPTKNVVIEIDDAATHDYKGKYDEKRDNFLKKLGLTIIRFSAKEILKEMNEVVEFLKRHPALRAPLCQRGTDTFQVYVLDGITGSGKTQVYFDSVLRAYQNGKSVLLMMPEIALTAQFMHRFEKRFGAKPVVWHSNLTAARRREIWRGVARGDIRIIVGTRSALFLPWQNLGLVVVDEEHDGSYKQEDMGNYHARDMAILRAAIAGFPIVLASATPSAETMKNIHAGKYKCLRLTSRFGGATLPHVETIDMRKEKCEEYKLSHLTPTGGQTCLGHLSPTLCDAIAETLHDKKQVMLFINRRGFAPIVQCKKCGWAAQCPDCSVGMVYHKGIRNQEPGTSKLLCHICGHTEPLPKKCPDCGGEISTRGMGLEKIQEEVNAKFPHAKTALVSSDTMMSRQALERLVSQMESGEIDIVIGTQILAKGHHFPNLTLVGVVDADMGLFGSDFRAGEHTFQQLFQVAGRAGRGEHHGRVMLQTYQPEHPVMRAICAGDRDTFMANDMESRRIAKMPPYGNLIALIVECEKENILQEYCKNLSAVAPVLAGGKIMGPIMAQLYQVRNWYRMRFLVSGDERANLQPVVRAWIAKIKQPASVRVKIDVAPQSFM